MQTILSTLNKYMIIITVISMATKSCVLELINLTAQTGIFVAQFES